MKKLSFFVLFSFLYLSCDQFSVQKTNEQDVLDVNPESIVEYVNLSEIADSIECVKLVPKEGIS